MQQSQNEFQIAQLIRKYLTNEISESEQTALNSWLAENKSKQELFNQLINETSIQNELKFFETINVESALQNIKNKNNSTTKIVPFKNIISKLWYAAAVIIFLIAATIVFDIVNKKSTTHKISKINSKPDIAPGGLKAQLQLANGSVITLDSLPNKKIAESDGTGIANNNGQLIYTKAKQNAETILYNTLLVPKGGIYQLILSDGTKVWLNAASSLKYPTKFTGAERKVFLSGEAYFEVIKNNSQPFKVVLPSATEIQDLGTSFNVMSYDDEKNIETSLVEGKVKIIQGSNQILLSPTQQAVVSKQSNELYINKAADIDQSIAWKNGNFYFKNDDINEISKQLSRWYNIDVTIKDKISKHYTGIISRQNNISSVLKMLELAGGIHFEMNGNKITVTGE